MLTSYEMNSEELTPEFIKIIKKIYKNKRIEVLFLKLMKLNIFFALPKIKSAS